jgi:hypothetical protein
MWKIRVGTKKFRRDFFITSVSLSGTKAKYEVLDGEEDLVFYSKDYADYVCVSLTYYYEDREFTVVDVRNLDKYIIVPDTVKRSVVALEAAIYNGEPPIFVFSDKSPLKFSCVVEAREMVKILEEKTGLNFKLKKV